MSLRSGRKEEPTHRAVLSPELKFRSERRSVEPTANVLQDVLPLHLFPVWRHLLVAAAGWRLLWLQGEQQELCAAHLHEVQRSFTIQITGNQLLSGRSLTLDRGDTRLVILGQRGHQNCHTGTADAGRWLRNWNSETSESEWNFGL